MRQPLFPPTISTQLHFAYFLAVKAMVRKFGKSDGQTGSWCLDKAVLVQGGGANLILPSSLLVLHDFLTAHHPAPVVWHMESDPGQSWSGPFL